MDGRNGSIQGRFGIVAAGCPLAGNADSRRRKILLTQKLADKTVFRPGIAAQMTLVGLMLRTGIAVDVARERLLVMMKRCEEHQRKDDRQKDCAGNVSFYLHPDAKISIS